MNRRRFWGIVLAANAVAGLARCGAPLWYAVVMVVMLTMGSYLLSTESWNAR